MAGGSNQKKEVVKELEKDSRNDPFGLVDREMEEILSKAMNSSSAKFTESHTIRKKSSSKRKTRSKYSIESSKQIEEDIEDEESGHEIPIPVFIENKLDQNLSLRNHKKISFNLELTGKSNTPEANSSLRRIILKPMKTGSKISLENQGATKIEANQRENSGFFMRKQKKQKE